MQKSASNLAQLLLSKSWRIEPDENSCWIFSGDAAFKNKAFSHK
jgi:hypothetical protein